MRAQLRDTDDAVRSEGYARVCGVDEVGRGPLAGPVVAAAVVLPPHADLPGLDDSKRLGAPARDALAQRIRDQALAHAVGWAEVEEIDRCNILRATFLAMERAVAALRLSPDILLIDGNQRIGVSIVQRTLVKGDARSACIAAASILAKVHRDALMDEYAGRYPGYGFERHKGYGTEDHREALSRLGPCPIHRVTFRGVREFCRPTPRPGELFP
jgi:ribonuclease HII